MSLNQPWINLAFPPKADICQPRNHPKGMLLPYIADSGLSKPEIGAHICHLADFRIFCCLIFDNLMNE